MMMATTRFNFWSDAGGLQSKRAVGMLTGGISCLTYTARKKVWGLPSLGSSGAVLLGVFRNRVTRPATGKPERDVIDFTRFKRFFYVGPYVGHGPQGANLFNEINGKWRRRWDSNPRDPFGPTPLAGERLRPLGHVSTDTFSCQPSGSQEENPLFRFGFRIRVWTVLVSSLAPNTLQMVD